MRYGLVLVLAHSLLAGSSGLTLLEWAVELSLLNCKRHQLPSTSSSFFLFSSYIDHAISSSLIIVRSRF